jgi:hypothetical protein
LRLTGFATVLSSNCRVDKMPGHLAQHLIGAWDLVTFTLTRGSDRLEPFGPDPVGVLYYDADGRVFVNLGARTRARATSNDNFADLKPDEALAAMTSFVGYSGRWELDEQGGFVVHRIEMASFPNLVDIVQKRFFSLDRNVLTLTTPPRRLRGAERSVHIVWRKSG